MQKTPKILEFKSHSDSRGSLLYLNEFKFDEIKRMYHVKLPKKKIIRAFHGHLVEQKYAYVTKGSVLVLLAKLSSPTNPSKSIKLKRCVLNSDIPSIIYIPSGYANGIMSLQNNSEIIFFSTSTLKDSLKDDYRFPENYWGKDVWK